jgi:hypothetical protein
LKGAGFAKSSLAGFLSSRQLGRFAQQDKPEAGDVQSMISIKASDEK